MENERIRKKNALISCHPHTCVQHQSVMLPNESFEKIFVLSCQLSAINTKGAFKSRLAWKIANNTENFTSLPFIIDQNLVTILNLTLEKKTKLHVIHAEDEVSNHNFS
jgi:hypothetical protein